MNVIRLQNGQEVVPLRGDMARYLAHPENLSPGDILPFMARVYRDYWEAMRLTGGLDSSPALGDFAREYWRDYPEHEAFGFWVLMACLGLFWLDVHGTVEVRFRRYFARVTAQTAPGNPRLPQVELRIRGVSPEQAGSYVLAPGFRVIIPTPYSRCYREMRLV